MRVSFAELARTGAFASLRLGASRAEVIAELGEPDDTDAATKGARILRYGGIEFHFADAALFLIYTDHLDSTLSGARLDLDDWALSSRTRLSEVTDRFEHAGIDYDLGDYAWEPHSSQLRTSGGVLLVFIGSRPSVPEPERSLAFIALQADA